MKKYHITSLIAAGLIAAAGNAGAAVRAVPVKIAPLSVPSLGMPVMPLISAPNLPSSPITDNSLIPAISLPGVKVPLVQPNPIERPTWPVQSIKLVIPEAVAAQTPESAIEKAIEKVRKAFQFDQDTPLPTSRINTAFDGTKTVKSEPGSVVIPEENRPAIDQASRPQTLPEEDLLRELGF